MVIKEILLSFSAVKLLGKQKKNSFTSSGNGDACRCDLGAILCLRHGTTQGSSTLPSKSHRSLGIHFHPALCKRHSAAAERCCSGGVHCLLVRQTIKDSFCLLPSDVAASVKPSAAAGAQIISLFSSFTAWLVTELEEHAETDIISS